MKTTLIVAMMVSLASPATAPAAPQQSRGSEWSATGNSLLEKCAKAVRAMDDETLPNEDLTGAAFCMGYVTGILESDYFHQRVEASPKNANTKVLIAHPCIPDSVTTGEIVRVIVKWLRANPDKLHTPAALVVSTALRNAFPCKP